MPGKKLLVVARESELRHRIADLLLASDCLVFCACDASEAIDFELTGLAWRLVVFGGVAALEDARTYTRRSTLHLPAVVVWSAEDDWETLLDTGASTATMASLADVVQGLMSAATGD